MPRFRRRETTMNSGSMQPMIGCLNEVLIYIEIVAASHDAYYLGSNNAVCPAASGRYPA